MHLRNGLRKTTYEQPEKWLDLADTVKVDSIDIIFSKYPLRKGVYYMHYDLLCSRLANLFGIDEDLNSASVKFRLVPQTHCTSDEQVAKLFHRVAIHYSLYPKEEPVKAERTYEEEIERNSPNFRGQPRRKDLLHGKHSRITP